MHVVSKMGPLMYLFEKATLNGRLSRLIVNLAQFDLKFVPQKAIKGFSIYDFLADFPLEEVKKEEEEYDFPDEDLLMTKDDSLTLYFDGASNQKGCGVGVLLESPNEEHILISIKLNFYFSNNVAEYEACILGLEIAVALGIKKLIIYGDSSLIINQIPKR
ncbi:uncharacterized protein LOC110695461 [Chenopodium quinoa]|uniref:uncharacterized protein LOC110695461 n=1 Tax=Chenopodium quinoa TaxID=63459 RepID=UPI000B786BD8|nr:uncharacterized protein LOC110695461 [Chenopodium quinoa]